MGATWLDVLSEDADVLVAVRPRVLVPEADHVSQLVSHYSKLVAVFADGDGLRAAPPPAHVGAAAGGGDTVSGQFREVFCSLRRRQAHPQGR